MGPIEQEIRKNKNLPLAGSINLLNDLNLSERIAVLTERSTNAISKVLSFDGSWKQPLYTKDEQFKIANG